MEKEESGKVRVMLDIFESTYEGSSQGLQSLSLTVWTLRLMTTKQI